MSHPNAIELGEQYSSCECAATQVACIAIANPSSTMSSHSACVLGLCCSIITRSICAIVLCTCSIIPLLCGLCVDTGLNQFPASRSFWGNSCPMNSAPRTERTVIDLGYLLNHVFSNARMTISAFGAAHGKHTISSKLVTGSIIVKAHKFNTTLFVTSNLQLPIQSTCTSSHGAAIAILGAS